MFLTLNLGLNPQNIKNIRDRSDLPLLFDSDLSHSTELPLLPRLMVVFGIKEMTGNRENSLLCLKQI